MSEGLWPVVAGSDGADGFVSAPGVDCVGCVACAIAPDWPLFLFARTVQGVGTALTLACTPALATAVYPPEQRVKALAGYAMAMSLAATVGPFLGGILVDMWGWQAVFWVRVPIALLALTLSGALPSSHTHSRHFDLLGACIVATSHGLRVDGAKPTRPWVGAPASLCDA